MTLRPAVLALLAAALLAPASAHGALPNVAYALSGTNVLSFDPAAPSATTSQPITGINAGETPVGIDVRPQNGQLYLLGVNATANTGTLYVLNPRTGYGTIVGTAGGVALTTNGTTAVDLPDPATTGYGFDVNPAVDRMRVVTGSGVNFRLSPATGLPVDGDNTGLSTGTVTGTNPDGPIAAGPTIDGAAYTNNTANDGGITTLYTLGSGSDSLYIQNPANVGTQNNPQAITLGGSPLDFAAVNGFDIAADVNAPSNGAAVASGDGYAALKVGGASGLYRIKLTTGQATFLGPVGNGTQDVTGLALPRAFDDAGVPVVGLNAAGTALVRFQSATPTTTTTQALATASITVGETLVGATWRTNGMLTAVGINATADTGHVYRLDPQTGAVTTVGAGFAFAADLPDPATTGYGLDVNPTVDRIRLVTTTGLNLRLNPETGAAVDGDTVAGGTQPDGSVAGGVTAAAYTNAFAQPFTGGASTLYDLDPTGDRLVIQNPPNAGTLVEPHAVGTCDAAVDFDAGSALDIPGDVAVATAGAPATGEAIALLRTSGANRLYRMDLANGKVAALGDVATPLRSIAAGDAARGAAPAGLCPAPVVTAPPTATTTTVPTVVPTVSPTAVPTVVPAAKARLKRLGKPRRRGKRVDSGYALVCPASAAARCSVTVTVKAGKRRLGRARVRAAVGTTKRLRVTLTKKARKRLKRRGTKAKLVLAVAGGTTKTVKVKLRKR